LTKRFLLGFLFFFYSLNAHAFWFFHTNNQQENVTNTILTHTEGLNPQVLSLALNAYNKLHQAGYDGQQMLTIVDYSKPSTEPRLWVIDLKNLQVPFHELVAHGKNSGENQPISFSDKPNRLASSIGVYLTEETYIGKHGYSLRLNGLEPGFNDNARSREIVVHAANYVSEAFARVHGQLGRSWGCFALNPAISSEIINKIKEGTVLFAYYPDPQWLKRSTYLSA
jgi:hypothetical protein